MTVALALLTTACAEPHGYVDAEVRFEVADSAGIELVRNGLHGPWGPDPATVREVLRIGVVEGAEPYQFSRISDVEIDPDGRILVGNGHTTTVRVFDPEGRFLREFGGSGDGPGEFIMVNRVVATDGDVTVIDWQGEGRSTRFSLEGRVLATARHTGPDGRRVTPSFWTPAGWYGSVSVPGGDREPLPEGTPVMTPRTLHLMGQGAGEVVPGSEVDLPPAIGLYATAARGGTGRDWGLVSVARPTGVDRAGHWIVAGGIPYRIEVFAPDGVPIRHITRDYDPVPLDLEEEVEAHLALAEAAYLSDDFPMGPEQGRSQFEQYRERVAVQARFPVPDHRPPARSLLVSPEGSFWVERVDHIPAARLAVELTLPFATERLEPLPSLWDVFDAGGRLLGQAELPPRFTPFRLRGDRVWGVLEDDMGVEYVVALEVQAPA